MERRLPREPSMRPRFMNRGSLALLERGYHVPDPSMRPRFMNRGSCPSEDELEERGRPSMRPRFMNRGSASGVTEWGTTSIHLQ